MSKYSEADKQELIRRGEWNLHCDRPKQKGVSGFMESFLGMTTHKGQSQNHAAKRTKSAVGTLTTGLIILGSIIAFGVWAIVVIALILSLTAGKGK